MRDYNLINFRQLQRRWLKAGLVGLLPDQALYFVNGGYFDAYIKLRKDIYPISVDFASTYFDEKFPPECIVFKKDQLISFESSPLFSEWIDRVIYPSCMKEEDKRPNKLAQESRKLLGLIPEEVLNEK